jgi:hypothetical protein
MIAYSEDNESGIGFLAKERLEEESDNWCDKAVNPQRQPSMMAKEMEAYLLVYKMLFKKVKTECDSLISKYDTYKQDKAKYDHVQQYSHTFEMNNEDQQPLMGPPKLPNVVLLGTFFLPPAANKVKKEKDTTGKRKHNGWDEENVEGGSKKQHSCLVDDEVEMEKIDTIAFPI